MDKLYLASDYQEAAHPAILKRLAEDAETSYPGYGADTLCEAAREKIRAACSCSGAEIHFLAGGTQANLVMIDALLQPWQGVVAADSGHISVHEAGAIEHGGHKVLTLRNANGKVQAEQLAVLFDSYENDDNRAHMVEPGLVYLSQPTEFGTLYTRSELEAISTICHGHGAGLYVDGARLAYALSCSENDVSLADLARLCDAFYIGGTKCGALFGEAVVIPRPEKVSHLFTRIKQHGALPAKGWLLGLQFDTLFTDGLYFRLGKPAVEAADRLRRELPGLGFPLVLENPTNQVFCVVEDQKLAALRERVVYSYWEKWDAAHTVIRFAPSWFTAPEHIDRLLAILKE